MDDKTAANALGALGNVTRLRIYRLLVRQGLAGLVAGEIGAALGVPPTNLSFHLKALVHAGLLTVTAEGRYQRYRANMALMLDVVAYLTEECCAGHPEQCAEIRATSHCPPAVLPSLSRVPTA